MDRELRDQVWLRAASCCEYCQMPHLFHPRSDVWVEHFQWAGAVLTGVSAIGRATVRVLEINVRHRVIHRQALIEERVFPPRHLSLQSPL